MTMTEPAVTVNNGTKAKYKSKLSRMRKNRHIAVPDCRNLESLVKVKVVSQDCPYVQRSWGTYMQSRILNLLAAVYFFVLA